MLEQALSKYSGNILKFVVGRFERKVLRLHGPMDDWGARCDNNIYDICFAPDEPGSEKLMLDIHYNNHEGLQPLIVSIHGGGWSLGDKSQVNHVFRAKYLANHGYVVANINYRLLPDFSIKTQVEDVMGAIIWIKEHASEYGADPDRVGVSGSSAGGHLAAMAAWAYGDEYFTPTAHANSKYNADVLAAVGFYGLYDLEKALKKSPFILKFGTGLRHITKGPERAEFVRKVSPLNHISSDIAPTFFVCGDKDSFGLYPDSVHCEARLRELGVDTGLFTARGANHTFDSNYASFNSQQAMEATTAWFDKYLKGQPE